MSIVCIKIGENELSTYPMFNDLSKHLDIIEVLPRKRDKDGKLLNRTMGIQGDKEYLGIEVNMDDLTDEEFEYVRILLKERWEEIVGYDSTNHPILITQQKRLRNIDLSKRIEIRISQSIVNKIKTEAIKKKGKLPYSMLGITNLTIKIPFANFARTVINKKTNQTLEAELGLTGKTIKQAIPVVIAKYRQGKGKI